jgi:hypothetical protein
LRSTRRAGPLARRRGRAGVVLSLPALALVVALLAVPIGQALLLDDQLERPDARDLDRP